MLPDDTNRPPPPPPSSTRQSEAALFSPSIFAHSAPRLTFPTARPKRGRNGDNCRHNIHRSRPLLSAADAAISARHSHHARLHDDDAAAAASTLSTRPLTLTPIAKRAHIFPLCRCCRRCRRGERQFLTLRPIVGDPVERRCRQLLIRLRNAIATHRTRRRARPVQSDMAREIFAIAPLSQLRASRLIRHNLF